MCIQNVGDYTLSNGVKGQLWPPFFAEAKLRWWQPASIACLLNPVLLFPLPHKIRAGSHIPSADESNHVVFWGLSWKALTLLDCLLWRNQSLWHWNNLANSGKGEASLQQPGRTSHQSGSETAASWDHAAQIGAGSLRTRTATFLVCVRASSINEWP